MPTKKDKEAELKRICGEGLFRSDAQKVIAHLGMETIEDDEFRTTHHRLGQACFGGDHEHKNRVKTALSQARSLLRKAYNGQPRPNGVEIDLPLHISKLRPHVQRRGRVALTFNDPHSSPVIERERAKLTGPHRLWQFMVHAKDINEICLLFQSPSVRAGNGKAVKDEWAGSGEVKAAHLIGECTSRLVPWYEVKTLRWSEFGKDEHQRHELSMIILGSASDETKMKDLRERDRWKKQQRFHFERSGDPRHPLYIRQGSIDKPLKTDKRFNYAVQSGRRPETDYALISFFKDHHYSQTLIAMQGISTVGTLAAAQLLCTSDGYDQCSQEMKDHGIAINKDLPAFEMLLEVTVHAASPFKTKIKKFLPHEDASSSR